MDRPSLGPVLDEYVTTESPLGDVYALVRRDADTYLIHLQSLPVLDGDATTPPSLTQLDTVLVPSAFPPTSFDLLEQKHYWPDSSFFSTWAVYTLGQGGLGADEADGSGKMITLAMPGLTWDVKSVPYTHYQAHLLVASGLAGLGVANLDLVPPRRDLPALGQIPVPGDTRAVQAVVTPTDTLALAANGRGVWVYQIDTTRPFKTYHASTAALRAGASATMYMFESDIDGSQIPVWSFQLNSKRWNKLAIGSPGPIPRWNHRAIYDSKRDAFVVFGGSQGDPFDYSPYVNPWRLNLGTMAWEELVPTAGPPDGNVHQSPAVIYDPGKDRMIVFGGGRPFDYSGGETAQNETWSFDFTTKAWSTLTTPDSMYARSGAAAVYVPGDTTGTSQRPSRMVLFGGEDRLNGLRFADLWTLDLNTDQWTRMRTFGVPPPAYAHHLMIYDDRRDRLVFFGDTLGRPSTPQPADIWTLNLDANSPDSSAQLGTWEPYHPPFITLRPRIDMAGVFDDSLGGAMVFGGMQDTSKVETDLNFLDFNTKSWSPVLPEVAAFVDSLHTAGSAEGLAVHGDSIYVADGTAGVSVLHLGRISNPSDTTFSLVKTIAIRDTVDGIDGYARAVNTAGHYLYVAGRNAGVQVWDTNALDAGMVASYPLLQHAEGLTVVGWRDTTGYIPSVPAPVDSAFLYVADANAFTILQHESADSIAPVLAVAPVEKPGLPGRLSIYAVASECLAQADSLFPANGLRYRFNYTWHVSKKDSHGQDSIIVPVRTDSTAADTLDAITLLDSTTRLYGSSGLLDLRHGLVDTLGTLIDSLRTAFTGSDFTVDSTMIHFLWVAGDQSPAMNVGTGYASIAAAPVVGSIGGTIPSLDPAIRLEVPAGSFSGRATFYLIDAKGSGSQAARRVPWLDPLAGTPELAASGLRAAGGWCRLGWSVDALKNPVLLHLPLQAGVAGSGEVVGAYRAAETSWEWVGGRVVNGELVVPVDRPGLYRVLAGASSGSILAGLPLLDQNVPNPFNPRTTINYRVPVAGLVTLGIYDVQGRLVRTLEHGFHEAGVATVLWTGNDDAGKAVASGIYFYRIQTSDGRAESRKMVLVR